jgi:hypothetical protein
MTWWRRRFDVAISDKGATTEIAGQERCALRVGHSTFATRFVVRLSRKLHRYEEPQRPIEVMRREKEGWLFLEAERWPLSNASSNLVSLQIMRSWDFVTRCAGTSRSPPVGTNATALWCRGGIGFNSLETDEVSHCDRWLRNSYNRDANFCSISQSAWYSA